MPTISLEVFKDGECIESILLENKPFFLFGRHPSCDVILMHESLSRFHTAFIVDKEQGVLVVDLMSKAKTKLDGEELQGCMPYKII
jgi:nuclear inhibitor of protein phosphatase 1